MANKKFHISIICLVVAITIFSQITDLGSFFRPAMYVGWVVLLVWGIVASGFKLRLSPMVKMYLIFFLAYFLYCLILSIFGQAHMESRYLNIMPIPLLVMLVASLFGDDFDEESLNKIAKAYIISALFFSIWIHYTYFASYSSWLSYRAGYLFETKNSAAQTISIAVYLIVFIINKNESKLKKKVIWYVIAAYMIILLGICQARTSLIGIALSLFIYAIRYSKKQLQWIAGVLVFGLIALQIPAVQIYITKVFEFSKYETADLNTISSGRWNGYIRALSLFWEKPFIGRGNYYIDCSYISILTESGIIGLCLIEPIWITRVYTNYNNPTFKSDVIGVNYRNFIVLLTVFYFVESLLEAFPPFGPGVTCFGYWFMCEAIWGYGKNKQREMIGLNS